MKIRDMENEDGETRGLIEIRAFDHLLDDHRRVWRFSVKTGQGGGVAIEYEWPDVRLYPNDEAVLAMVGARLWVLGKNSGATLPDGRAFSDIHSHELWAEPEGGTLVG